MKFREYIKESTFSDGEISIYSPRNGSDECKISKDGKGYYCNTDDFDFSAKNKTELKKLLKKYGYVVHQSGEKFI